MAIRHKVNVKIPGLKKANIYLGENILRGLKHIGDRLQEKIRSKARVDTGEERRRTVYKTLGKKKSTNQSLSVYNTIIQALVDETGARKHFPPYRKGSKLYKWVVRKGFLEGLTGQEKRQVAARFRKTAIKGGANRAEALAVGRFASAQADTKRQKQIEGISFLIARSISRRGLPRPGDKLRKPFETTRKESINMINTIINFEILAAVKQVNDEGI